MMTTAEALQTVGAAIVERSDAIKALTEQGVFDRATAEHRLAELVLIQGAVIDTLRTEVTELRDGRQ